MMLTLLYRVLFLANQYCTFLLSFKGKLTVVMNQCVIWRVLVVVDIKMSLSQFFRYRGKIFNEMDILSF